MLALIIILIVAIIILICIKAYENGYKDGTEETERAYIYKFCEKCANYKTTNCPNSSECFSTLDKPHFKIKENKNV